MADPTLVNGQTTDAVTQTGVITLGVAPAYSLGSEYQTGAHALGLAMQNATANQRQGTTLATGATTQGLSRILTIGPSLSARATVETLSGRALFSELISLATILKAMQRRGLSTQAPPPPSPPPPRHIGATDGMNGSPPEAPAPSSQPGSQMMSTQPALDAIRKAADHLNALLEEFAKQPPESRDTATWKRLCDSLDGLRRVAHAIEDLARPSSCPSSTSSLPVGATPPGVVIVGAGNIIGERPASPHIVGSSW